MLTKPLPGATLVPSDLTRDLTSCFIFNETSPNLLDYARNKRTGNLNTGVWSANDSGFVAEITGATNYIDLGKSNEIFNVAVNEVIGDLTIICKVRPTSTGQRGVSFGPRINPTNTLNILHAKIPNQAGYVVWAAGGNDESTSLTAPAEVTSSSTFAFVLSQARGAEIWMDGTLIASDPEKVLIWYGTNVAFALGDASTTNVTDYNGIPSQFSHFYVYRRVLTGDEIRALSNDPYQIFSRRLFYIPVPQPTIGGVKIGGKAYVSYPDGVNASGTSLVRARYRTTGAGYVTSGTINGGTAEVGIIRSVDTSGGSVGGGTSPGGIGVYIDGGAVVGSTAVPTVQFNLSTSGGVVDGGSSGPLSIIEEVGHGGAVLGSSAPVELILKMSGGCVVGGSTSPTIVSVDRGVGGASCSGVALHNVYAIAHLSTFGAFAGGKAIVTRKGPSRNVRTGIGRCLNGTNKIKDAEALLGQKEKIIGYTDGETPVLVDPYLNKNLPTWCDLGEKCPNGAYLPKITKKIQGVYLPAKQR